MRATAFVWNFRQEDLSRLRYICMRAGIALRPVAPSEDGLPIGRLPAGAPPETEASRPFADRMLVMAGFSQPLMNRFLDEIKKTSVGVIRLKAILTPTNAGWNALRLHDELAREDAALHPDGQPS